MRQHLIVLLALATAAHAETKAKATTAKHEPIDITDAIDKVDVLRDEAGKLYVIPKEHGADGERARRWMFYGDGRTMYLQRVTAFSTSQGDVTIGAWSPRARGIPHALVERKKDSTANVICRMQDSKYERRPLALVSEDDAKKLFKTATFEPPLWERRVFFFGRGDGAKYYLVDILDDEHGGQGFRLFVGPKGQMKQVAVSDFASDTGGASVITKTGELSIPKGQGAVTWKQGKKLLTIARLEPKPNAYLIYRELGVYGQLGTICEDQ